MNHSKLVEEARELADNLCVKSPPSSWHTHAQAADAIRTLATIVEQQDVKITRLAEAAGKPDPVRAELVAACKTCDEVSLTILAPNGMAPKSRLDSESWHKLNAARHLIKRAAKLAETEGDHVEATLAEATTKYDDLLKRLGDTTNRVAETAPPVVVEMRLKAGRKRGTRWECKLGGIWVTGPVDTNEYWQTLQRAEIAAMDWLFRISQQLGMPLVGVWKEGE